MRGMTRLGTRFGAEINPALQSLVNGATGGKKQRLSGAASKHVGFEELPGSGSRLKAARLFFDLLSLQARDKVGGEGGVVGRVTKLLSSHCNSSLFTFLLQVVLQQEEPYAELQVSLAGRN